MTFKREVDMASKLGTQLKEQSVALAHKAGEEARKHPIAATALVAAAIGIVAVAIKRASRPPRRI
ncbi:hypothetical protein DF3PB_10106 [uncultured Defluviicoccus sp.]|uniref:Uncharacterized protein n=1 Tax=metagenome TaxID=256318 RepID=A0A380T7L7_9ZZZZ|nr:hypothetical protein DF3PB_10106 [uncultured Defluviicoccus sp.]